MSSQILASTKLSLFNVLKTHAVVMCIWRLHSSGLSECWTVRGNSRAKQRQNIQTAEIWMCLPPLCRARAAGLAFGLVNMTSFGQFGQKQLDEWWCGTHLPDRILVLDNFPKLHYQWQCFSMLNRDWLVVWFISPVISACGDDSMDEGFCWGKVVVTAP